MVVIPAAHAGMCFGVRNAIQVARRLREPQLVTIHGQLVHNPQIQDELKRRGFRSLPEDRRDAIPETPRVLITAHGISGRERKRLLSAGKELIDTTCPLVQRIHETVSRYEAMGYFVVVVGRRGHVEVDGIVGSLEAFDVVQDAAEARTYSAPRIGVVGQSTVPLRLFRRVLSAIRSKNPRSEIHVENTVCPATQRHQEAVAALLKRVDALVVVGGRNSHNTRQLGELAESEGVPWLHVESAGQLDPDWFEPFSIVGLAAGTSTPDSDIQAVYEALLSIGSPAGQADEARTSDEFTSVGSHGR
jgi:4-hydroxy-3-methylbut-2-enyl diphosphate reductase